MKSNLYAVPESKKIRVIICTDAYCEADDQFAIVHALLTPKFDVVGIVAEHFGERDYSNSMEKSFEEIVNVVELMGLTDNISIFKGEPNAITDEFDSSAASEGVTFIVEEALREDSRPLFVLNIGAITNLATAYKVNPKIEDRLLAVWIGGGPYPAGHMDFNLGNDLKAANIVMNSNIELWQIPLTAYTMMEVSFHELFDRVKPCGAIGDYLVENVLRVNEKWCSLDVSFLPFVKDLSTAAKTMVLQSGESWSLGDNPAVGVLITPQNKHSEQRLAQNFNSDGSYGEFVGNDRTIRVYHSIDSRVILEDLFAKIKYHYE